MEPRQELITIPRFDRIRFLYHGFGTSRWEEEDFKKVAKWQQFKVLYLKQVHSDVVHFIQDIPGHELRGDALVTVLQRLFLVIKSADCLPVLLVDIKKRVIAAVHCGWKGTLRRVLGKTVSGIKVRYRSSPLDILAALGPCISADCYEVGEEVHQRFEDERFPASLFRPVPGRPGKYFLDLREANRLQLQYQGIPDANIFSINVCTHCDLRFPSLRRDKESTGRMLSFIGLSS